MENTESVVKCFPGHGDDFMRKPKYFFKDQALFSTNYCLFRCMNQLISVKLNYSLLLRLYGAYNWNIIDTFF